MKQITFGIVGCGIISRVHARAIVNAGGLLIGACSHSKASAEKFAEEFNCKVYDTYSDMISDSSINTVCICTPSGNHFENAKDALYSGKNVVIEKPMCITLEQCDKLIEIAEEKNLKICVISQSRFSNAARDIYKTIQSGVCGKPVSAQLMMRMLRTQEYYDSAGWRGTFEYDGGGVLMNQGIHGIDLLCYLFGKPKAVTGFVKTRLRNIEVEDTAAVAVEFENGAVGVIDATTCANPAYTKKFIFGFENGTIVLENDVIKEWTIPVERPKDTAFSLAGATMSDNKAVTDIYHVREFENYINALNGKEELTVDAREGRMPVSVILGAYESSKTGKRVVL